MISSMSLYEVLDQVKANNMSNTNIGSTYEETLWPNKLETNNRL